MTNDDLFLPADWTSARFVWRREEEGASLCWVVFCAAALCYLESFDFVWARVMILCLVLGELFA